MVQGVLFALGACTVILALNNKARAQTSNAYPAEYREASPQPLTSPATAGASPANDSKRKSLHDCPDCPEMVEIPAGQFVMGASPDEEERENLSEAFRHRSQPQRRVRVRGFWAGKYEITRRQYRVFVEETRHPGAGCFMWVGTRYDVDPAKDWRNPGYAQDDSHPVACVSWEDASTYATWLSKKTGKRYRLLTEAEWEYAARAGTTKARFWGDDGNSNRSCDHANGADATAAARLPDSSIGAVANCNDRHAYTAPVGSYRANAFGLHDMLGNVWEWTQDCWNATYNGAPVDGTEWTAGDCTMRAVRGGSWDDAPVGLRAAYRVGSPTSIRVYGRGFRVARDP